MSTNEPRPKPPLALQRASAVTAHGETRTDEFAWLRDRADPQVVAYLEAENRYTAAIMEPARGIGERLYEEFVSRIREDDETVPVRLDAYRYYTRTCAGAEYPLLCRRHDAATSGGAEEVILDLNRLAAEREYFALGSTQISPDHRYLAYSEDLDGSERYTLRVRDLVEGQTLEEAIVQTSDAVAWYNDSQTLIYTLLDDTQRPWRVMRHRLGEPPANDVEVLREEDAAYFVSVDKTKDRRYLLINLVSNITSEAYLLDADDTQASPSRFWRREEGVEYSLEHRAGEFFVLTNRSAVNFELLRVPAERFAEESSWQTFVGHRDRVKLEDFEVFEHHLALLTREAGVARVWICDLVTNDWSAVAFGERLYTVDFGDNPTFTTDRLRLLYSSLVTPPRVYDYDMAQARLHLLKQREIPCGYEPAHYRSERLWARSADGVPVPISIVRHRDTPLDGSARCLLYGYGSYGICTEPTFSSSRISLLERGFIYAIAHVRGGGELGEHWKNAGKLLRKPNSFADFIACAQLLIDTQYTRAARLAVMGGSAGGLLIGAAVNSRPDLFRAAVAEVPFVDVLNTMADPSLPLTVIEYDEWGNPAERRYYETIRDYAPYENIRRQRYPDMLVIAGWNDPRVPYWEPAKWVARLRRRATGGLLLLKTDMEVGHSGTHGRYQALKELAFVFSFLLLRLDLRG
ncbi:S9 family peptidase [Nitrococcus mobilis]|uniref:Oligopeptidase n=1 Tax=Nitrococcus mobilis Nb-231 TaxID=314278 RepID=A4BRP4_9GAMM|nr:S9 family peptidase [Nitrococcus mobilis]EAR21615.1 oligopeptidase [Nitrococcus mobilis Nb-231]